MLLNSTSTNRNILILEISILYPNHINDHLLSEQPMSLHPAPALFRATLLILLGAGECLNDVVGSSSRSIRQSDVWLSCRDAVNISTEYCCYDTKCSGEGLNTVDSPDPVDCDTEWNHCSIDKDGNPICVADEEGGGICAKQDGSSCSCILGTGSRGMRHGCMCAKKHFRSWFYFYTGIILAGLFVIGIIVGLCVKHHSANKGRAEAESNV